MWALVVGSILTTVVLVIVNKWIFQGGFPFVLTLSWLHFVTTYLVMVGVSAAGMFEPKSLPWKVNLLVSGMGVGSIAFMNYSLRFNSVGVYQMAKLCVIPTVLAQQIITKWEFVSRKVFASLCLVLFGVGAATVTDVTVNSVGLIFATFAVLSTAQYQIWIGSKQREYGLSEMQATRSVAGGQILVGGVFALLLEGQDVLNKFFLVAPEAAPSARGAATLSKAKAAAAATPAPTLPTPAQPPKNGLEMTTMQITGLILLSCLLAVSANAHSFALIGRTSAVTFQVVGHGKTILILVFGYVFFPLPATWEFIYNVIAVTVAVFGVVLYSSVKANESLGADSRDLYDQYAPTWLLNLLVPERTRRMVLPTSEEDAELAEKSGSGSGPKP